MSVLDHPTRTRILNLLRAIEDLPGDPPALMGLDDLDPDVVGELLPTRARLNGDKR